MGEHLEWCFSYFQNGNLDAESWLHFSLVLGIA